MKKDKSILAIIVVTIYGYIRLFSSDAFNSVRAVDIMQLLATGALTGILIMAAKDYFHTTKQDQ